MLAEWIQEQIKAFGRMLGLTTFSLNEHGMVAVQFENGVKLRLEYQQPILWIQVLLPFANNGEAMARLLTEAHPHRSILDVGVVRVAYLERSGEAFFTIPLSQDQIEASIIDAAFRELFERAIRLGRGA